MKNKLRKFVGIMVGLVAPLALNLALAFENAITPEMYFPLALTSVCLVAFGVFVFEDCSHSRNKSR